nr:MAG TPA: hypothetical protein [Caudoviricetes sp.]
MRPWGRCPLISPEDSSPSPTRETHTRERTERVQGEKTISLTRKKYFPN